MLYLKAHHARSAVLLVSLIAVLSIATARNTVLLPQLVQGFTRPINMSLLLALAFPPIAALSFGSDALLIEANCRRRLLLRDLCLVAVILAPVIVAAGLVAISSGQASGLTIVRNDMAFLSMSLILLAFTSVNLAAVVPIVYFLAIATLGSNSDGTAVWWAWLRSPATPTTAAIATGMLIAGWMLFSRYARRRAAANLPAEGGV